MEDTIELQTEVASDIAEDLREAVEDFISCDCEEETCTSWCLYARLIKGREVLLEAGA